MSKRRAHGEHETHDALVSFDRADLAGHFREHCSIDGLRSFCGVELDGSIRMPAGVVRCLRCARAAAAARAAPPAALPGPPVAPRALIEFLAEAFAEAAEADCARQIAALADASDRALAQHLVHLQSTARTLTARRLIALAVQVIKKRRSVRQLQMLRQALVYGG